MALLITKNPNATPWSDGIMSIDLDGDIRVRGTDLVLESLYVRLLFINDASGTRVDYNAQFFLDKAKYLVNDPVTTTVTPTSGSGDVLEQTQAESHRVAKEIFEKYGYNVTIIL